MNNLLNIKKDLLKFQKVFFVVLTFYLSYNNKIIVLLTLLNEYILIVKQIICSDKLVK